ncbi:hypothetical protein GCM10011519_12700 [Marmoricola endophyticus]|uniref:Sporulation stage II protein D amidase enhancer LytB N-terminal domain-containing protein n=1 Tax=Marmoricola endophyticus TaxID=2040280 RepID=A0A917BGT5_9ACTN|nr:SpoIID/LytB domain-containing protein [Marmoricola endophyticus]GGF40491.1 hypothetical protein GCM10011519_12700 [Marmoricola endophyticus]
MLPPRAVSLLLVLVAALLTAAGTGSTASAATVSQTFTVPASGRFTVVGHGFGHGHGMSQYGADGAAARGLGHERILAFYYPGTTLSRTSGDMRVRMTRIAAPLLVQPHAGLQLLDSGVRTWNTLPTAAGITRWRLTTSGTRSAVDFLQSGTWKRWHVLSRDGVFRNPVAGTVTTVQGSARTVLRDRVAAITTRAGSASREVVNTLPLESYLRGVVAREMPASWSTEAVRAQAVAARTYAVWSRAHGDGGRSYSDICDTTSCQVYAGVAGEHPLADKAIAATSGKVLTYAGKPAFTQFSASSGGWSAAGSVPYLVARSDPYDATSRNTVHTWSTPVSTSTLQQRYPAIGRLRSIVVTGRQGPTSGGPQWGGRVSTLKLVGTKTSVSISGDTMRAVLGLRSTWFWFGA